MKPSKINLLCLSIAGALMFMAGCDKNFVSINTDPEHATASNMNYNYLFTSAELITSGNSDANAYEDWRNNLIYCSCMIQHLSSTVGYWDGDKYFYNPGYNSAYWDQNYPNTLTNIVEVVTHAKDDPGKKNFYNIARIFKAFMFQRMTDMYGDIPYSQAGMGFIAGITHPKYDKQQDIYTDLLNELQSAAQALDPSAANTVGGADIIYGGDVAKWKKFAYSEMLRVAMRLSKVDPANAQKWAQAAVQGGVMGSNDDNALLAHQNQSSNQTANGNAWVLDDVDPGASRLSKTFVDYLKSTGDPRLTYFGTVCTDPTVSADKGNANAAIQLGQPNGYDNNGGATDITHAPNYPGNQNNYSVVNRNTFARLDAPTFFLTYSETELLLAEAAYRGWVSGSAATFYVNGVTAAMQQLMQTGANPGVSDAQVTLYLATNPFNPVNALAQINTQYWVATFMDEYETWANWRRSGYPVLTPVSYFGNTTNATIPRRFTYPLGEPATNAANYSAATAGLSNGDKMTSRVWWDK